MKKNGFTMVELIAIIVVMASMLLIILPSINNTIKQSEEKKKEEALNNIYMAAENFLMDNYEDYKIDNTGDTTYVYITDLVNNNYMNINTTNPNNDSSFTNKDVVKVTRNEDNTFHYELITLKTIYEVVTEKFPELETNGNGCVNPGDDNYSYMGGCYIKGNLDNNYIWYSGFLWRIMGINADGTVRLITDENVTAIPLGAINTAENWDDSYAKDWLNNYFYPRLKGNNIIKEETWCSETITSSSSARTTCENNLSTTQPSNVGLMTLDEYNLAGGSSSYLNIGQYQWTMTPYSSSSAWYVQSNGIANNNDVFYTGGLRAVINVNSDVTITGGNGTLGATWSSQTGPYILNEDKSVEVTGKLNEKATSGEYVLFVGRKYRVVDKDSNGNTKLILDSYYEETEGTVYTMSYGSNNTFSKDTGIGQKLNSDVLNWLTNNSESEKAKLVSDYTWYQNNFGRGQSYKVSLNEENPTRSIQATVGLIRVGEMLSVQSSSILTKGYTTASSSSNANTYWTMTPYTSSSGAWYVNDDGYAYNNVVSYTHGLRAVIVVNSDVTITGGNGTWSNPYQI